MPDNTEVVCAACGYTEQTYVTEARPGKTMVRCTHCGLIFVLPQWTDLVADDVFAEWNGWPEGIVGGATNRQEGMRFIAQQITKHSPTKTHLLDIGCANGAFFDVMRREVAKVQEENAWMFYGAEPDPKWQGFAYSEAQVVHKPLRQCNFPDSFFDVVTLLDAIYYVSEPDKELAEVARILKPGGILVFDISSQPYLKLRGSVGAFLRLKRTRTFAAYPFYYSHLSLQFLMKQNDLKIVAVLADRGAVQSETSLRYLISIYLVFAKAMVKLSRNSLQICPKSIYVVRKNESN